MRPGSARAMLDHGETRVPNHCVTADMDDTGAVSHSGRHPSRRRCVTSPPVKTSATRKEQVADAGAVAHHPPRCGSSR